MRWCSIQLPKATLLSRFLIQNRNSFGAILISMKHFNILWINSFNLAEKKKHFSMSCMTADRRLHAIEFIWHMKSYTHDTIFCIISLQCAAYIGIKINWAKRRKLNQTTILRGVKNIQWQANWMCKMCGPRHSYLHAFWHRMHILKSQATHALTHTHTSREW